MCSDLNGPLVTIFSGFVHFVPTFDRGLVHHSEKLMCQQPEKEWGRLVQFEPDGVVVGRFYTKSSA